MNIQSELAIAIQIENNLNSLFDKECPPKQQAIMTNKDDVLDEFKKWYNFWYSKRPEMKNPNIIINNNTKLLLIKMRICDNRILGIIKELEKIGLYEDFMKKFNL
jgi:hypothetical protein